jgi:hypothetical protein
MSFRGARLSQQHRERIARCLRHHHERKRLAAEVAPRDLRRLKESGVVARSLQPLIPIAEMESAELIESMGGVESITPQVRILIEDCAAVGMALRGTLALYLQGGDPELASRIGSLATARRSILQTLGLDRVQPKALDLKTYLERRGEGETNPAKKVSPDAAGSPRPDTTETAANGNPTRE